MSFTSEETKAQPDCPSCDAKRNASQNTSLNISSQKGEISLVMEVIGNESA